MSKYFDNEDIEDLKLIKIKRFKPDRRDAGVGYNVMERLKKDYKEFAKHLSDREMKALLEEFRNITPLALHGWLQLALLDMEDEISPEEDSLFVFEDKESD